MQLEVPADWLGTRPEWAIFAALTRLKVEFEYQSSYMGGRLERGGVVVDFYIPEYNLVINIQSVYWHYGRPEQAANDQMQRIALEGMGIKVIYIDEEAALRAPLYYVQEALRGNDHSRTTR